MEPSITIPHIDEPIIVDQPLPLKSYIILFETVISLEAIPGICKYPATISCCAGIETVCIKFLSSVNSEQDVLK